MVNTSPTWCWFPVALSIELAASEQFSHVPGVRGSLEIKECMPEAEVGFIGFGSQGIGFR